MDDKGGDCAFKGVFQQVIFVFLVALERAFLSVEAVEVRGVSSCFCNSSKFQFTKQFPWDTNTRHLTALLEISCLGMLCHTSVTKQNPTSSKTNRFHAN